MLRQRVNGSTLPMSSGPGHALVCVHGSLGDFRTWMPVMGLLSRRHRMIAVSCGIPGALGRQGRRLQDGPARRDLIGFIEWLSIGRGRLMGHSAAATSPSGVAQPRRNWSAGWCWPSPARARRQPCRRARGARRHAGPQPGHRGEDQGRRRRAAAWRSSWRRSRGPDGWRDLPAGGQAAARDNARTILGQANEDAGRSPVPMRRRSARRPC